MSDRLHRIQSIGRIQHYRTCARAAQESKVRDTTTSVREIIARLSADELLLWFAWFNEWPADANRKELRRARSMVANLHLNARSGVLREVA